MFLTGGWTEVFRSWEKKLNKAMRMPKEEEPAMKTFKPANENVPRLKEYGTDLGDAYWDKWVCNSYKKEQGSFIDHDELRVVAEEMDHPEKEKVEAIAVMLQYGADIGVQGEGRWPSVGKNNDSVYEYGDRVADSLQTGVKDGIDPRGDRALGRRCLQEMAVRADVAVGRDYVLDMEEMIRDKLLE